MVSTHEELIGQAESLVFKIGEKESRGKKTFTAIHELMTATLKKSMRLQREMGTQQEFRLDFIS